MSVDGLSRNTNKGWIPLQYKPVALCADLGDVILTNHSMCFTTLLSNSLQHVLNFTRTVSAIMSNKG